MLTIRLSFVATTIPLLAVATARAQYKLETCEDLKITKTQFVDDPAQN